MLAKLAIQQLFLPAWPNLDSEDTWKSRNALGCCVTSLEAFEGVYLYL